MTDLHKCNFLKVIFVECNITRHGPDSSVGIATRYGLDGPGFEFSLL